MEGAKQEVESAMRGVVAGALGVLATFAAKAKGLLTQGLYAAGRFEQTTIAFETMLGSAEEAKKMLGDLSQFAAITPFEMPEILQAATGLVQFGERGEELMETLNLLGNAASATSTSFGMIALIFNQIRGVGKLLTQDFRQLSTRGVLSLQDIADHFGVASDEAQKMLSAGKISFEDVKDIFRTLNKEGGRFYNLMERQSQSFLGLKSTLSDAWNIMVRTLSSEVIPVAKAWLRVQIKVVEAVRALVVQFPDLTAGALTGATAFAMLGTAIAGAVTAMRLFGLKGKNVIFGMGLGVAVLALGAAFGILVSKFGPVVKAWVEASGVIERLKASIEALIQTLRVKAVTAYDAVKAKTEEAIGYMIGLFNEFKEPLLSAFESIKSAIVATWEPLKSVILSLLGPLMDATEGFAKLIAAKSGIYILQAALKGVIALVTAILIPLAFVVAKFILIGKVAQLVFDLIGSVLKEYGTDFIEVGRQIMQAAIEAWNWIVGVVRSAIDAIRGFLMENKETFFSIWNSIKEIVSNVIRTIIALFNNLMEIGKFVIESIGELFNWMFGTNLQTASDFFSYIFAKIAEFLDWVSLMSTNWALTWELMKTNTAYVLLSIADKATMLWNTMIAGAIGAGKGIFAALSAAAYNIGLTFQIVVASIKGMFKGLWEGIKNKFKGKSFSEGFSEAYNKERAKVEGGYKNMGDEASKAFNEAFVDNMGADSPFKAELDDLAEQARRIKEKMEAERDAKRKAREERDEEEKNKADFKFKVPGEKKEVPKAPEKKKPEEAAADKGTSPFDELGQGRFGFADIGTKLQDILLKGEKGKLDEKRNGLLEAGLKKQDEVVKAVKEAGAKPAALA